MLSSLYVLNTFVKFIFHFQIFYKYTMVGDSSDEDLEIERVEFSRTVEPSFFYMFMIPRGEGSEFHVFQEFVFGNYKTIRKF